MEGTRYINLSLLSCSLLQCLPANAEVEGEGLGLWRLRSAGSQGPASHGEESRRRLTSRITTFEKSF